MDPLNLELKKQAIALGLCDDWSNLWNKDWGQEKMIERMYTGLDFCLKHHWPANDFIQKNFNIELLRSKKVFVNDKYSTINPKESLVLGRSEVIFRYNVLGVGNIHIRDHSIVKVYARGRSFVIVHLYEQAKIEAKQFDKGKIVLVKHSPDVFVEAGDNVKIREEYDYLS